MSAPKIREEQLQRYIAAQGKWAANEHTSGSVEDREEAYLEMRNVEREVFSLYGLDPRFVHQIAYDGTLLTVGRRGWYAVSSAQQNDASSIPDLPPDFG